MGSADNAHDGCPAEKFLEAFKSATRVLTKSGNKVGSASIFYDASIDQSGIGPETVVDMT